MGGKGSLRRVKEKETWKGRIEVGKIGIDRNQNIVCLCEVIGGGSIG